VGECSVRSCRRSPASLVRRWRVSWRSKPLKARAESGSVSVCVRGPGQPGQRSSLR
jgi:hypothetical protein